MTDPTDNEKIAAPFKWSGDESQWPEWRFEMINYARRHSVNLPDLMVSAEESAVILSYSDFTDEVKVVAGKLMTDLALRTKDKAKKRLMQVDLQWHRSMAAVGTQCPGHWRPSPHRSAEPDSLFRLLKARLS